MAFQIRIFFTLLLCIFGLKLKAQQSESPNFISPHLTFVWESQNILEVPESVFFDSEHQCLYVSNIKDSPTEHDGNGYLSKLDLKGNIIQLKWIDGLDAPKGIGKLGNFLYVSDINKLIVIDIQKQQIIKKYPIPNAKFLNDVTTDSKHSIVYVSDMAQSCIYRLSNGVMEKYLEDEALNHVNGLFFLDGFLFAGVKNQILKIDTKTKHINTFVDNTGSIDGLIGIDENEWLISDWKGNIQYIRNGKITKILGTADQKINAADIGFIPNERIILVPTFYNKRIVAYKIK